MSYDPRCQDLAEVFLEDRRQQSNYQTQVRELAQDIQDAIESFFILNPESNHDDAA